MTRLDNHTVFRNHFSILVLGLIFFSAGCAGLTTDYDPPGVTISSFKTLAGKGGVPRFEIGLHITNPNRSPLELQGAAYTLSIEGYKLLTGVANDLPSIPAYGEGTVTLTGSVSLLESIAFFANLVRNKDPDRLSYKLEAKLDPGRLHPVIRVNKTGTLSLDAPD